MPRMKRTGQFLAVVFMLLSASERTFANGKMFVMEEVPPDIPYQRALILYRDGVETLVLQSKFQMTGAGSSKTIGWVVPIPAIPEVAGMTAQAAETLFSSLSMATHPKTIRLISTIYVVLFVTVSVLSLLSLLWGLSSFLGPLPSPWLQRNRTRLIAYALFGFTCCFLATIYAALFSSFSTGESKTVESVEIVSEHQAGVYDVRIVRSKDASELCAWLNANSFRFGEQDIAAFESYISKGWCFAVAIINPARAKTEKRFALEGLAEPLILRFPSPQPIYPLALTGTGNFETEVLIYVASTTKMSCKGRITLRYAGRIPKEWLFSIVESNDFFKTQNADFSDPYLYLCKFKDRLRPKEMTEDLVFSPAKDSEPYRESVIMW